MKKINNKGFTLVETMLCFVLLGVIMVIASQIIHSTTEAYYFNRSMSYGMQAAQIVATELRGELEDSLPLKLYDTESQSRDYCSYYMKINDSTSETSIEFIGNDGNQIKYSFKKEDKILKKYIIDGVYKMDTMRQNSADEVGAYGNESKIFDSKYIGMGYEVHDIAFEQFYYTDSPSKGTWNKNNHGSIDLKIGDYPVLVMTIKVGNNQYDEYECKEYIPLYNFYGIKTPSKNCFGTVINVTEEP